MKLYGTHLSPFFERIFIALDIKNAADQLEIGMPKGGIHSDAHYADNPMGKIPYLKLEDGTLIIEGQVIAEYLDAVLDGPKVFPEDPLLRARANVICRLYDLAVIPAFGPILMAMIWDKKNETAIENAVSTAIPKALDDLERHMSGDIYAVGDSWSIADAALIPMLFQIKAFMSHFGIKDVGDRPKLKAWAETVTADPIGQASLARAGAVLEKIMAARQG